MKPEYFREMTPDEEAAYDRADSAGDTNALIARGEEESGFGSRESNVLPGKAIRYGKPSGRSPAEITGGDVSRDFANDDAEKHPMTPDERTESRRGMGHISYQLIKNELAYNEMLRRTEGDPRARAVALRKLADGKK